MWVGVGEYRWVDVFPIDSRVRIPGDFAIPLIATHLHPRSGLCENLAHPATSGPRADISDASSLMERVVGLWHIELLA